MSPFFGCFLGWVFFFGLLCSFVGGGGEMKGPIFFFSLGRSRSRSRSRFRWLRLLDRERVEGD